MLYFSKIKLFIIYFIIIFLSFFTLLNFIDSEKSFITQKINLGLDLQGGSYLLLEVDSSPTITQHLQQKLLEIRKSLKKNKIKYKNINLKDQSINFTISKSDIDKFDEFFFNKNNSINNYYNEVRSYELDYLFENNQVSITYSKFGLI